MSNDERIAVLETTISHTDIALNEIMMEIKRLNDKIDSKIESVHTKIDGRFDALNNRLWTEFYWMVGGFASILLIISHGFKWF